MQEDAVALKDKQDAKKKEAEKTDAKNAGAEEDGAEKTGEEIEVDLKMRSRVKMRPREMNKVWSKLLTAKEATWVVGGGLLFFLLRIVVLPLLHVLLPLLLLLLQFLHVASMFI